MIIYKVTNKINGKIYIGSEIDSNPNYYGSGVLILKALKEFGKDNFKKENIETCDSLDDLKEREIFWIKKFNSTHETVGYNTILGANGAKQKKDADTKDSKKLTSVKILPQLRLEFKKLTLEYQMTFQKLVNRSLYLYSTNADYRHTIDTTVIPLPSGSLN
jgi:hypothetical protein